MARGQMKPIRTINTTVKEVLNSKFQGAYIYTIKFSPGTAFYIGITLRNVKARFKTHVAKFQGVKKYPDRAKCLEMVFEDKSQISFKCVGRQTFGYKTIRELLQEANLNFDLLNADVQLMQISEKALDDHGTDLGRLTNKFYMEKYESTLIETIEPLENDETIHLAKSKLKALNENN